MHGEIRRNYEEMARHTCLETSVRYPRWDRTSKCQGPRNFEEKGRFHRSIEARVGGCRFNVRWRCEETERGYQFAHRKNGKSSECI